MTPPDTRSLGRRWLDFWFAPADPTTLGFMRIITGVIIIYVHLTYSFDLQSFFGVNAWYSLEDMNHERRDFPSSQLGVDWEDDITPPGYIPEYPHRRKAVVQYYRKLAELSPQDRAASLAYVQKLNDIETLIVQRKELKVSESLPYDPAAVRDGLDFIERIPYEPLARKNRLDMIVDPKLVTVVDRIPAFVDSMSEADRKTLRTEIENFLQYLPVGADHRRYVLNHLTEINGPQRRMLLTFFADLPEDKAERDRRMDYLVKWNNEARKMLSLGSPIFSIWFHITNPAEMAVAHAVVLLIMVMFTAGLFTKVTSVLTWLVAVSYIHRTQQILFGMDTMMNLLLIFLMIGPSGKALSVDRWRACRRAKLMGVSPDVTQFLAAPPLSMAAGFAQRLLQVQFCFIYAAAGFSKLKGVSWWNHEAFWDTVANPEFTLIHYPLYEDTLRNLVKYRPVYAFMAAGAVLFTLFMELALPFLVWTRLRPYMVIGGVMFHLGIGVFMGLNIFGLLMMTLLLSYLPGEAIRLQLFGNGKSSGRA